MASPVVISIRFSSKRWQLWRLTAAKCSSYDHHECAHIETQRSIKSRAIGFCIYFQSTVLNYFATFWWILVLWKFVVAARAHNSTNYRTSSSNRKSNKLWQTLHQRSTAYCFKFLLFTIFLYSEHFWELFISYRLSTYLPGEANYKTEMQLDMSIYVLEILNAYMPKILVTTCTLIYCLQFEKRIIWPSIPPKSGKNP